MSIDRDALLSSVNKTYTQSLAIIERKNRDYGADSDPFKNFRGAALLSLSVEKGILLRLMDKIARVDNLLSRPAAIMDESLEDTLVDAIGYLAILKAFRELEGDQ